MGLELRGIQEVLSGKRATHTHRLITVICCRAALGELGFLRGQERLLLQEMGWFAVIKVKGAVQKQKGFVLNLMCSSCLWMSVTDSVLRKSVCLAALRKGGLELHRCTPSHGYLALDQ